MQTYKYKTVTCDECGTHYQLRLGPVELFGNEVWYADEDDPDSQLIIRDDRVTCYDCNSDDLPSETDDTPGPTGIKHTFRDQ